MTEAAALNIVKKGPGIHGLRVIALSDFWNAQGFLEGLTSERTKSKELENQITMLKIELKELEKALRKTIEYVEAREIYEVKENWQVVMERNNKAFSDPRFAPDNAPGGGGEE